MELVATASFITAFIAGVAALFAPCCIGVLLPSYLASVFKTKTKIFLMTFIFYLGALTIFIPLGLGIAGLSGFFTDNHSLLFSVGGLFMLALGVTMLLGKSVMLPIRVHPKLEKYDFGSIYVLGIFSGIATTCCAPVLAGVLALSVLPGSFLMGTLYTVTFVTGMVVPLFIMAVLIDRGNLGQRFKSFKRRVSYSLLSRKISLPMSSLISGFIYIIFGLFILIYQRTNPDAFTSSYQIDLNLLAAQVTRFIHRVTDFLPETVWAAMFMLLFILIGWLAYRQANDAVKEVEEKNV